MKGFFSSPLTLVFVSISPVGFAVGKCQHKYGIKMVWSASWCRFFKMEEIKYRFQVASTWITLLFIFFFFSFVFKEKVQKDSLAFCQLQSSRVQVFLNILCSSKLQSFHWTMAVFFKGTLGISIQREKTRLSGVWLSSVPLQFLGGFHSLNNEP